MQVVLRHAHHVFRLCAAFGNQLFIHPIQPYSVLLPGPKGEFHPISHRPGFRQILRKPCGNAFLQGFRFAAQKYTVGKLQGIIVYGLYDSLYDKAIRIVIVSLRGRQTAVFRRHPQGHVPWMNRIGGVVLIQLFIFVVRQHGDQGPARVPVQPCVFSRCSLRNLLRQQGEYAVVRLRGILCFPME